VTGSIARSERTSRVGTVLLIGAAVTACGAPLPSRPSPIAIETIGLLADEQIYADHTVFILADGRRWERPNDEFRIAYQAPAGSTLFIAGTDSRGTYVLLVGGQDGLPAQCQHAIGYGGVDFGDGVAAEGFLWRKAPAYQGGAAGTVYRTTTRFCLDDQGRVASRADLTAP
jgi:hypothetical protein